MAFIISSREGNRPLRIYYEDLGNGPAILFITGWPLSHQMWEYQVTPLREKGYRCITYDRRGFGQSDNALNDYSYEALANDLNALIEALDISEITLVGFSMGGGEVIKYLTQFGKSRISKIILVSSIIPYMLKTADNPNGVPSEIFEKFDEKIRADRPEFLNDFGKTFFSISSSKNPVSEGILQWVNQLALNASAKATLECMKSFSNTDFRTELSLIDVPTLIIHGDLDLTVPIEATSMQAAQMIPNAKLKVYEGAPHGLFITDMNKLNRDIDNFIQQ